MSIARDSKDCNGIGSPQNFKQIKKNKIKLKYNNKQNEYNKQKLKIIEIKKQKQIKKRSESNAKKAARKLEQEHCILKKLSQNITNWLKKEEIEKVARATGYFIRVAKLAPLSFLVTLAFGSYGNEAQLRKLVSCFYSWFNIKVSAQAFSNRLNNKNTVMFMKSLFKKTLEVQLNYGFQNAYAKIFKYFKAVFLEDSSQFELPKEVAAYFPGSGGGAGPAAIKLNFTCDITRNTTRNIDITSANVPDQKLGKKVISLMKAGELYIRDLGYFDLSVMLAMINNGVFFLSRLKKGVHIYIKKCDEAPIDVNNFLKIGTKDGKTIDQIVYAGELKVPVRFIAEAVPHEVKLKRIQRNKKKIKKSPTEDYITWCGFSVFITNVPKEVFASVSLIITIYKIRWQIELFFKRLKSITKIDIINVESKNRVLSMVYGRLIGILTAEMLVSYATSICDEDQELSEFKLVDWLAHGIRLGNAIRNETLEDLIVEMISTLNLHCKDKRKKQKSTQRVIEEAMEQESSIIEAEDKVA